MKGQAINELVYLIRKGMGLDDAHCVAYNQMIPIAPDEGIFVAVGILDSRPYAASLSYAPGASSSEGVAGAGLLERQTLNLREVFSIHLMSRNNDARNRRADLIFALTGTLAAQRQDEFGYLIGKLPVGFADASETEGAERLNRYVITVAVLSSKYHEAPVDYFDRFRVIVNEEYGEDPQEIDSPAPSTS